MADKEIGALTAATTLAGTELAHIVQGANSRKVTTTRVISEVTHAAVGKTTPIDADELPVIDTAASDVLKKLTWANIKATLETYFDTLYLTASAYTAADVLAKLLTVDGTGSGIDADLLDGQSSAAFLPAANLTGGKVTIASSAPGSPATGDVWIDTT